MDDINKIAINRNEGISIHLYYNCIFIILYYPQAGNPLAPYP